MNLTPRQYDVLRMVAAGGSYRTIGLTLHVSKATVAQHMKDIYRRIGAASPAHAVALMDDGPKWRLPA